VPSPLPHPSRPIPKRDKVSRAGELLLPLRIVRKQPRDICAIVRRDPRRDRVPGRVGVQSEVVRCALRVLGYPRRREEGGKGERGETGRREGEADEAAKRVSEGG
jgi:hypothetical protein